MIRKEILEDFIVNEVIAGLHKPHIMEKAVKGLLAIQEQQTNGTPILKMLAKEKRQTENAIQNIMTAIEKGVITNTTTKRLKELETQQENLERQILIERSKTAVKLSENDIRQYYEQALRLEPQMLIDYLIKEIVLYDDKIEIYYNSPIRISPDNSQGFSLYFAKKNLPYIIQNRPQLEKRKIQIEVYIK